MHIRLLLALSLTSLTLAHAEPASKTNIEVVGLAKAPKPTGEAKARFDEAEEVLQAFGRLEFKVDKDADIATWSKAYGEFMRRQAKLMGELQGKYAVIAATAPPELAVPALIRVGEVVERFSESLVDVQLPTSFPPEARKQMQAGLAQVAASLHTMALGQYEQAVQRASAAGVTGEWVEFAKKRKRSLEQRLGR